MLNLSDRIQPALQARQASLETSALLPGDTSSLPLNVLNIPRTSGLLSDLELELTEQYDATSLLEKLAKQEVSAETLLVAFRKRATIAQQCVGSESNRYFKVEGQD